MIDGLITGSSYDEDQLKIEWRGDKKETTPIEPSYQIALRFVSGRECIGYRSSEGASGSLLPCPDNVINITRSQCPDCLARAEILPCLRCTGEVCRNQARRDFCIQPNNHALYLASFAPGVIKVGVSRWSRRRERLLEQGARSAIIVARDDGQMIRRHEAMIAKFGYPDRLSSEDKLRYMGRKVAEDQLEEELFENFEKIKPRMYAPWLEEAEKVPLPDHPNIDGLEFATFWRPNTQKLHDLVGRVLAVTGQIIIIQDDSTQPFAIDARDLVGYRVAPAPDGARTGGQMQLSLFT